MHLYTKF